MSPFTRIIASVLPTLLCIQSTSAQDAPTPQPTLLKADNYRHFIDAFNAGDRELYTGYIPNAKAWDFLKANIPLLDCPDKELEQIYYFRWWTYRKHIEKTPDGFVITEFLPAVKWAGKFNTICCAAGHHVREGRWLADQTYLNDYARFWFSKDGNPRAYSFWAADSLWAQYLVTGDDHLIRDLLPALIANYKAWEQTHRDANGLYWQTDNRDGMEISISGALDPKTQGYRATINSYQFGDAMAISKMAEHLGQADVAKEFADKAAAIKQLVEDKLWDSQSDFFKVLPRHAGAALSETRELHGYTPWYFDLPDADQSDAWEQVMDPKGFYAPFGLTTAERRSPGFAISYEGHECQWNGPSWPFATSVTLTAMANLLNDYQQKAVTPRNYFDLLKIYAHAQHRSLEDGTPVPWIDENLNPLTGDWISRTRLKTFKNGTWDPANGGEERGKDYNHSTYCDLIINGLIGLRAHADNTVEVNPLVPPGEWDHFCLDGIGYHGHWLTIVFDQKGIYYSRGKGFRLFSDGMQIAAADRLQRLTATLR
jgi:hypothetical protein